MVTAAFTASNDYAQAYGLWQWDYGQELRIQGLDLPAAVEIHFALTETGGEAVTRVGVTKDGITTVPIPDSMLEGAGGTRDYQIYAWVYLADSARGETVKRITMQVRARPKPQAFEAPGDGELFEQAIQAVNEAAERAEGAGREAVSAASEAKEAATQTGKHLEIIQGLTEQVETNADTVVQDKQAVAGMLSQTQSAASEAALSAEAAKLSETAAGQAQAGAEAAEDGARQYAADAETDRQAVAKDKQAVQQMYEAVAADKTAVEQTAAGFVETAGQAVSDVNAAGKAQIDAIEAAGQGGAEAVETAKTEAVQAVTAEGDKQTERVQEVAAGVEADREQIGQNRADIAGLAEDMADLAPGVKITAAGTDISIKDAAEGRELRGLRVFGRAEQMQITGMNLLPFVVGTELDDGSLKVLTDGIYIKTEVTNDFYAVGKVGNAESSYGNAPLLTPGDYYAVMDRFVSNVIFYIVVWREGKSNILVDTGTGLTKKFTVQEGDKFRIFIRANNFSGKIKPMITKNQPTGYEQYTGGQPLPPSPDNPQEIEVPGATGNIEVTVTDGSDRSQFLTLQTPNGLPGTPAKSGGGGNYIDSAGQLWVCDEIDLGRGKYAQRIGIEQIIGGWRMKETSDVPGRFVQTAMSIAGLNGVNPALCNIAVWNDWGLSAGDNIYTFAISNLVIYLSIPPNVSMTADELNAKLNALKDPVVIIYQLAEPVERDLTPEELAAYKVLRTYSPTTVVSNNTGAWMEATYIADTKTYIDNKLADLSKTILDTIGGEPNEH